MQKIKGNFTSAVVFSDTAEDYALAQIKMICDQPAAEGNKIRVMPDVHPGKVGPIGLTMTIKDQIMPSLIGIDMGCGVSYMAIGKKNIEFQKLDRVIGENIPTGVNIRKTAHLYSEEMDFDDFVCGKHINKDKARRSLGTLGSGNHFVEIDRDKDGGQYVVIHSGSRHLGKEITEYYMQEGQKRLRTEGEAVPYELTWLQGAMMEDYLHDLSMAQEYARLNREIMLRILCKEMKWKPSAYGDVPHNYVDEKRILRKGAIAADAGGQVLIPINMRDGVIFGIGKGNPDWNCSAPHGAGRIMAKSAVGSLYTVADFKKDVAGIHSPSICRETLEEAPFAYRGIDEIFDAIGDTVEIKQVWKPVYNCKGVERR